MPENALELLTLLSPLLPVIATYLVGQAAWPKELKAGLAFLLSAVVALLTAYANGTIVENFWSNFFAIFTASQAIYWTFFKALGFERWVAPKEAVAGLASNAVHQQVASITTEEAKKVLDPATTTGLAVSARVVE